LARVYEALAWLYSGGQIARLKQDQAHCFEPGSRILYAGVGPGDELASAVATGATITALDSSARMLVRARSRLQQPDSVRFLCEDVLSHEPVEPYDVVVANFFLNVFSMEDMPRVLARLAGYLSPGGTLLVGDFAPPGQSLVERWVQRAYYLPPLLLFHLLTQNAWHPLYDYEPAARQAGLVPIAHDKVRIFGFGPRWLSNQSFGKGHGTF